MTGGSRDKEINLLGYLSKGDVSVIQIRNQQLKNPQPPSYQIQSIFNASNHMTFLVSSWHFFDRIHGVIDDCTALVLAYLRVVVVVAFRFMVTFSLNIRACEEENKTVCRCGIRMGMAESGVNHRKWKGE